MVFIEYYFLCKKRRYMLIFLEKGRINKQIKKLMKMEDKDLNAD